MSTKPANDIKQMSFENALGELESIVNGLESGQIDLENAIQSYTRGAALKEHCEKKLSEAKLKIEKITVSGGEAKGVKFEG